MAGRQDDHGVFACQGLNHEVIIVAFGFCPPNEGNVDLSSTQPRNQQSMVARLWGENDMGILQPVFADNCWNKRVDVCPADRADDELAGFAAGATPHAGLRGLHLRENDMGFLQHQFPGIGKRDASRLTTKKFGAELFFQMLNLQA